MTQHSTGPWVHDDNTDIIYDADDKVIVSSYESDHDLETDAANAAHIVKCVNAHAELVEALEHAREKMWEYGFSEDDLQPIRLALSSVQS